MLIFNSSAGLLFWNWCDLLTDDSYQTYHFVNVYQQKRDIISYFLFAESKHESIDSKLVNNPEFEGLLYDVYFDVNLH